MQVSLVMKRNMFLRHFSELLTENDMERSCHMKELSHSASYTPGSGSPTPSFFWVFLSSVAWVLLVLNFMQYLKLKVGLSQIKFRDEGLQTSHRCLYVRLSQGGHPHIYPGLTRIPEERPNFPLRESTSSDRKKRKLNSLVCRLDFSDHICPN